MSEVTLNDQEMVDWANANVERVSELSTTVKVLVERINRRDNKIIRLERQIKRLEQREKLLSSWSEELEDAGIGDQP